MFLGSREVVFWVIFSDFDVRLVRSEDSKLWVINELRARSFTISIRPYYSLRWERKMHVGSIKFLIICIYLIDEVSAL